MSSRSLFHRPTVTVVVAIAFALGSCQRSTSTSSGGGDLAPTGTTTAIARADEEWVSFVDSSIESLRAQPAVTVRFEATSGAGGPVTGEATIDNRTGSYRSSETRLDDAGSPTLVAEQVLVGSTVYVRFTPGGESGGSWTPVDVGTTAGDYLAASYTANGAILPDLDRLVLLMSSIPSVVRPLAEPGLDGYEVTFDARAISRFYRDTGIELVGGADAEGSTVFEVGARGGVLVSLRAHGTQFHDGEAIEDVEAVINYAPREPIAIEIPAG